MQLPITLIITGGSLLATLVSLLVSIVALSKARKLTRAGSALEGDFEESLVELNHRLDTLSRNAGEQGGRVAWLETRARRSQTVQPELVELASPVNAKPTITERRHRVLSLARRGQSAQTIAQTLGMPHGEVELMMNLLKAA